jgi:hypothetical protein
MHSAVGQQARRRGLPGRPPGPRAGGTVADIVILGRCSRDDRSCRPAHLGSRRRHRRGKSPCWPHYQRWVCEDERHRDDGQVVGPPRPSGRGPRRGVMASAKWTGDVSSRGRTVPGVERLAKWARAASIWSASRTRRCRAWRERGGLHAPTIGRGADGKHSRMGTRYGMAVGDRRALRMPTRAPGERCREWLRQLARSDTVSSVASLERRLRRQAEFLRDEIAEARQAGLSWAAIGALVGVPADVVRTIHDE